MAIDSTFYTHPSDRAALKALKAIPGFHQLMKAIMSIWNERLSNIENMSCNLRVNENQMKKYYDMLPPICEKLGINVPDLYIKMDVNPNAYTSGDTKPFIVLTSGLLERFDDELVKTVIAHECGHIACHHVLYSTIGRLILSGVLQTAGHFGYASLLSDPLMIAFQYWMRCSEFSADRAAIICDGNAEKLTQMCMRFSGYDVRFGEANIDEYIKQAEDYNAMMTDSKVNKVMEFYLYRMIDHPLNAVRAYEGRKWAASDDASQIFGYLESGDVKLLENVKLPVPDGAKKLVGQNFTDVETMFKDAGFTNVHTFEEVTKDRFKKSGAVLEIAINGKSNFDDNEWFPIDAMVTIRYKA